MGCDMAVRANKFVVGANKFAPTIDLLGLNHLTILLMARIQENFEGLGI